MLKRNLLVVALVAGTFAVTACSQQAEDVTGKDAAVDTTPDHNMAEHAEHAGEAADDSVDAVADSAEAVANDDKGTAHVDEAVAVAEDQQY